MTPEQFGKQWRESSEGFLPQRRVIVGLMLVNALCMGTIALYQTGITKHVPDPPLPAFDSEALNGSAQAYAILETPDAVLGLGSYAATMALAAMGHADRAEKKPWLPLLLAAKTLADAALAGKLLLDEPLKFKKYCALCITGGAASLAAAAFAVPEARAALRRIGRG